MNTKKNKNFSCFEKNETNLLESKNNFFALEEFAKNPEFHSHLYENHIDDELYKKILDESHSISKLFKQKIKNGNNNICEIKFDDDDEDNEEYNENQI